MTRKKFRPKDAAKYVGVPKATLDYWRWIGRGPAYLKLGGAIFYLKSDLDDFVESSRRIPPRSNKADGEGNENLL